MTEHTVPTDEIAQRAEELLTAVVAAIECTNCDALITLDPGPEGMAASLVHRPGCAWLSAAALEPICPPKVVIVHTTAPTVSAGPDGLPLAPPSPLATGGAGPQPTGPGHPYPVRVRTVTPTRRDDAARTTGERIERSDRSGEPEPSARDAEAERRQAVGLNPVDDGPT